MIHFAGEVIAVQIVALGCKICLPLRGEFPEVVPKSYQNAPFGGGSRVVGVGGEKFRSGNCGEMGDLVDVPMVEVKAGAGWTGLSEKGRAVRGEERFPFLWREDFSV